MESTQSTTRLNWVITDGPKPPVKILVVDDEPDLETLVRQRFRKRISEKEFEFVFARNGLEALAALNAVEGIEIVLTDINMPEMDGLTFLGKLGELDRLVKAVVISAYGDMDNIRIAMNRGAFDFLMKPIDFRDLEITLEKALQELVALKRAAETNTRLVALEQELNVAARIQQSIVPREFPAFPHRDDFTLFAEMIPARAVGGDLYDFFLVDENHLGFVIGDVAGKGVPAAIYMAVTRTLLKAIALRGLSPAECLAYVNDFLCTEGDSGLFVTLFYGILNTDTGDVEYSIAGHQPPYRITPEGIVTALDAKGGLVAGVLRDVHYDSGRAHLNPGDALLLFTDGISEAMNAQRELFQTQRLEEALTKTGQAPVDELVRAVIAAVSEFAALYPQQDDLTLLALRFHPN